ncbi:MAG: germination protein YpeB [Ruminococcus sp.]|nr:germination protein YpeB [Ruminococcus sp.]
MKKRTIIRIVSFAVAAMAVLVARNLALMKRNESTLLALQNNYVRAVEELSTAADNISNTLRKELFAGTADMHQKLSQQLWRDSSAAKAALLQLPVGELGLENTYKFLSQVGNYSLAMSEKLREGGSLSAEEYERLTALYDFSKKLCDDMWALEGKVSDGSVSFGGEDAPGGESAPPTVTEGFTDFEEGFDSYPTLVYDGPFSDHIMQKAPLMTSGKQEVPIETARQRAAFALGTDIGELTEVTGEQGKMPSYVFSDGEQTVSCAVTKQGGYVSYFIKTRDVITSSLSEEDALAAGDEALEALGYGNMRRTYFEDIGNIMTVNYAYYEGDICCYTDLIKVSVAMDSGEILAVDARGYLVNHQHRMFSDKRKSVLDMQKKVSPKLSVLSRGLAVIPSDSEEELLCYEFKCSAPDGTHVLVYFNAFTGREEQILILFESESGTLTM